MSHAFVHLELNTDDVGKAKDFYRALFGWSFTDMSMGDSSYTSLDTGTPPGGGVQLKPMPDAPTMWLPYVGVADVAAVVARARGLGAETVVEYMPIPGFGALAILRDPSGAAFGLWQGEPGSEAGERRKQGKRADKPKKADKKKQKKAEREAERQKKADKKKQKKADKKASKAEGKVKKDKPDKKKKKKRDKGAQDDEPKKGKRPA